MAAPGLIGLRIFSAAVLAIAQGSALAADWADWRGPNRDGTSAEKGLPEKWSLQGENLAWKAPYGGRSTPIVLGDRLTLGHLSGSEPIGARAHWANPTWP